MPRRPYQSPAMARLDALKLERDERRAHPIPLIVAPPQPPHSPRKRTPVVAGQVALPFGLV